MLAEAPLTIGHKSPEAGVVQIVYVAVRLPPREVVPNVLGVVKAIVRERNVLSDGMMEFDSEQCGRGRQQHITWSIEQDMR